MQLDKTQAPCWAMRTGQISPTSVAPTLGGLKKFFRKAEKDLRRPVKTIALVATGAALFGPMLALSPPSLTWANVATTKKGASGSQQRAKYHKRLKLAQRVTAGTAVVATIALAPTIAPALTTVQAGVGTAATIATLVATAKPKDDKPATTGTPADANNYKSQTQSLPAWLLPAAGIALAFLI